MQTETFCAGIEDQNLARAEGFGRMVEAAGHSGRRHWARSVRSTSARSSTSPAQRKRYLAQVRTLASIEISGAGGPYRPFDRTVAQVKEADVKAWLIGWDRSLKTKAKYHGLLYGVFAYVLEQGYLATNPCDRTAPKRSRIMATASGCGLPILR